MATVAENNEVPNARGSVKNHDNIWKEDYILSLASPYNGEEYSKESQILVEEIKKTIHGNLCVFKKHQEHDKSPSAVKVDLLLCLEVVDTIQSLDLKQHFSEDMKCILDYLFSRWEENITVGFVSHDDERLNLMYKALAFRLLRLNRYNVAPHGNCFERIGVLFGADKQDVGFVNYDECVVRSLISLLRASWLSFPHEAVLHKVEDFCTEFFRDWLSTNKDKGNYKESLIKEVEHLCEFPWYCSLPLREARDYIDIYQSNNDWLSSVLNEKILKLARLNFNIKQAVYQEEMKELMKWWVREVPKWSYQRLRPMESYFCATLNLPELEHADPRVALAKTYIIAYCLDDISDNFATFREVKSLYDALNAWDPSLVHTGTCDVELSCVLKCTMSLIYENSKKAKEKQGRDYTSCLRSNWSMLVRQYLRESEWNETKYIPTFDEYVKSNIRSLGLDLLSTNVLVLMDKDYEYEKYADLFFFGNSCCRMKDDIEDFKDKKKDGQIVNLVNCYVTHTPGATPEDAIKYMKGMIRYRWQQINLWYFNDTHSFPWECKTFCYDICRAIYFFLYVVDGFTYTKCIIKKQLERTLLTPA